MRASFTGGFRKGGRVPTGGSWSRLSRGSGSGIPKISGTKVCTGDFAPSEPEFMPEFCETNFGRPNFGPEFFGRIFDSVFPAKEAPWKIHPREIHLPKFTFQNSTQKSDQKIHIAHLQGRLANKIAKRGFQSQKTHFPPSQTRVFRVKKYPILPELPSGAFLWNLSNTDIPGMSPAHRDFMSLGWSRCGNPLRCRPRWNLRRGIGVGVKGVTGSCAIVAPRNPEKQGELLGNQLFMGTIALSFVNYCIAFCELLRLFPWPLLLRPQKPPP